MSGRKRNLDLCLGEVFKQCIAIKDDDYKKSQEVFKGVFEQVKAKMGEKCNYFGKYSSQVLYAGSVYDGIKVSKLDEFDMDIVIRLPINYDEGIVIENDQPGYVRLKIENAFDFLDKQQEWEKCHKVTRDWRDSGKYLLQNKFRQWMHGIVQKALNDLNGQVVVKDVGYLVTYKECGPAYTLNIQNLPGGEEFKLDVDLVPVIRFMYPRWPEGYRTVEESIVKDWLVVPKPNKAVPDGTVKNRAWRLSFQEFERDMMKGCQQLKTTIRLVKKLRDSLEMKYIASYYIKTIFLWKIDETKEKKYWQKGLSTIFRIMVEELYNAIKEGKIRYFWHQKNNLIENLKPTIRKIYADKLKDVLKAIDSNDVDKVVQYLLNIEEFQEFKKSDFYQKHVVNTPTLLSQLSRSMSNNLAESSSLNSSQSSIVDHIDSPQTSSQKENSLEDLVKSLLCKLDLSEDLFKSKLDIVIEKMEKLESDIKEEKERFNEKIDTLMNKIEDTNDKIRKLEMTLQLNQDKVATSEALEITANEIRLTNKLDGNIVPQPDADFKHSKCELS